jgi:inhibitor of KinA
MGNADAIEWAFLGDSCLTLSIGGELEAETCSRVLRLYGRIKEKAELQHLNILDVVPAYTSLAVYFDPAEVDGEEVQRGLQELLEKAGRPPEGEHQSTHSGDLLEIPVVYDGEDLQRVASGAGLSTREVVALHTVPRYVVAMIGFLPHFPYLIGLDKRLATPRLEEPRTRVPAGAVAIGGSQTGIYPRESPGGWNIIGRTDPAPLKRLRPGDSVVFRSLDPRAEE